VSEIDAVTVPHAMDALDWLRKQLEDEDADLPREMVRLFAERVMAAEVDARYGASFGK
jgi:hypothetical protein